MKAKNTDFALGKSKTVEIQIKSTINWDYKEGGFLPPQAYIYCDIPKGYYSFEYSNNTFYFYSYGWDKEFSEYVLFPERKAFTLFLGFEDCEISDYGVNFFFKRISLNTFQFSNEKELVKITRIKKHIYEMLTGDIDEYREFA